MKNRRNGRGGRGAVRDVMFLFRRPGPGRREVEQLLDGVARPCDPALASLLDAARRSPGAGAISRGATGELPGEAAALAAFRAAAAARAGRPSPEENLVVRIRTRFAAVAAVGALTLTAATGVAFAATGGLPGGTKKHQVAEDASGAPSASASPTGSPGTKRTRAREQRRELDERAKLLLACEHWNRDEKVGREHKASGTPSGTPSAAGSDAAAEHRKDPRTELVKAAGGEDAVEAFCADLVEELCPEPTAQADDAAGKATPHALPGCPKPEPKGKVSDKPAGKASDKPADKSGDKSSDALTDKPAGKSSDVPAGKSGATPTDAPADAPAGAPTGKPTADAAQS